MLESKIRWSAHYPAAQSHLCATCFKFSTLLMWLLTARVDYKPLWLAHEWVPEHGSSDKKSDHTLGGKKAALQFSTFESSALMRSLQITLYSWCWAKQAMWNMVWLSHSVIQVYLDQLDRAAFNVRVAGRSIKTDCKPVALKMVKTCLWKLCLFCTYRRKAFT